VSQIVVKAPESFTQAHYLEYLQNWDNKVASGPSKRIAVIGAGMSGLMCGWLLKRAGHEVRIFEASNVPGGRVKTLRQGFTSDLYAEAGAMRIPDKHRLTHWLIDHFQLDTWDFVNQCAKTYFHINNVRRRSSSGDLDLLGFGLGKTNSKERGRSTADLFETCLTNFIVRELKDNAFFNSKAVSKFKLSAINADSSDAGDLKLYHAIREALDKYSLRQFLKEHAYLTAGKKNQLSPEAQDFVVLLENYETLLSASTTAILDDWIAFSSNRFAQICGGMDLLPKSLAKKIPEVLRYNARVIELEMVSNRKNKSVFVRVENIATGATNEIKYLDPERWFDLVVLAMPFSAMRRLRTKGFQADFKKRRAVRQLHYDNSCKIILEFSEPFWTKDGITGGSSVTDLPIRRIYYPIKEQYQTDRCLLLASYTWGSDSLRWTSLKPFDRIRFALGDVARVHGLDLTVLEQKCIGGMSHSWEHDEFTSGAFALFEPYQLVDLFEDVWRPVGPLHYCGEHTSLKHGWIEGAVESGIRCAIEVCERISKDDTLSKPLSIGKNPFR
jgi:monoamine oxidase